MSLAVLKYMVTVMAVYGSYWGTGHWTMVISCGEWNLEIETQGERKRGEQKN